MTLQQEPDRIAILQRRVEKLEEATERTADILINALTVAEGAYFTARQEIAGLYKREGAKKPQTSTVNIPDIDKLPWRSYKTKQPCTKPTEAGWIFTNTKGAEKLAEEIKQHGKVTQNSMEYAFSGQTQQFISRKPSK